MIKFLDLKGITDKYADEILQAVQEVASSGWYLQGEATAAFEEHYAEYIGTRYCVGVANGLDALTLTYRAYMEMGIMHEGDEVIVPANTYIASILAITENGLKPVLVEPDINTLEMDDSLIEQHITSRTRSMMTVHLYGRCAYTERIGRLCKKYNLKLVEDNAQAHGCQYMGKKTGSLGDAAGHSFYPGKNLGAMGDAGAVTTDDDKLADTVRSLGNYGSARKYVFNHCGRNSRIDEIQAEYVAEIKLRNLNKEYILKRIEDIGQLEKDIAELEEIVGSTAKIKKIIIKELETIIKKYGQPRKSMIIYADEMEEEEVVEEVPDYAVNLFFTKEGYFKKITPLSLRMGGEHKFKEGDGILQHFETTNNTDLIFFTDKCQAYKTKAPMFSDTKASVLGEYIPSKLEFDEGENAIYMIPTKDYKGYVLYISSFY